MRGTDGQQATCFSYVSPEQRVPTDHPLRAIRALVNTVLHELSPRFITALLGEFLVDLCGNTLSLRAFLGLKRLDFGRASLLRLGAL